MAKNNIVRHLTGTEAFEERRKTARLDVPIRVEYRVLGAQTSPEVPAAGKDAATRNISAGGCLLLVAEELPIDAHVEITIFLGDSDTEALRLEGKIVRLSRQEKDLYEYGIGFDQMSAEARRLFADYCFAKMYQMIGLSEWPTDKRVKK